jgi:hypothetical protein
MAFEHVHVPHLPASPPTPAPIGRLPLGPRARRAAERERTDGHGHGMSRNRTPKDDGGLPHDSDRGGKQPYSREVEEYSGEGVARPPRDETERRDEPARPRRR